MIRIYGMESCPDCTYVEQQARDKGNYEMIDIGTHVRNLKEFLRLRDSSPAFDGAKRNGSVGIPCFVLEDGSVTLSPKRRDCIRDRPIRRPRAHRAASTGKGAENCYSTGLSETVVSQSEGAGSLKNALPTLSSTMEYSRVSLRSALTEASSSSRSAPLTCSSPLRWVV